MTNTITSQNTTNLSSWSSLYLLPVILTVTKCGPKHLHFRFY